MANYVIAGRQGCQRLQIVEHLADIAAKSLPDFQLHKIFVTPHNWDQWLLQVCDTNGWTLSDRESPLIWRELLYRGGKPVLVGTDKDFEYRLLKDYGISKDPSFQPTERLVDEDVSLGNIEVNSYNPGERKRISFIGALSEIQISLLGYLLTAHISVFRNFICCLQCSESDEEDNIELRNSLMDMCQLGSSQFEFCFDINEAFKRSALIVINCDAFSVDLSWHETGLSSLSSGDTLNSSLIASATDGINNEGARVLIFGRKALDFAADICEQLTNSSPETLVVVTDQYSALGRGVLARHLHVQSSDLSDVYIIGNVDGANQQLEISSAVVNKPQTAVYAPCSVPYSVPLKGIIYDEGEAEAAVKSELNRFLANKRGDTGLPVWAAVGRTMDFLVNGRLAHRDQFFTLGLAVDNLSQKACSFRSFKVSLGNDLPEPLHKYTRLLSP